MLSSERIEFLKGALLGCALSTALISILSRYKEKKGEEDPVTLCDFEKKAFSHIPKSSWDYFSSGAGNQTTQALNEEVLQHGLCLRPRFFSDVSQTTCEHMLLGRPCAQPWGIAPTAFHALAHPSAECATARSAHRAGVVYCLSGSSSKTMEEVVASVGWGEGRRLCQLYFFKSREANLKFIQRAEALGMEALVLTVDRPVLGIRDANSRNKFTLPGRKDKDPNACAYEDATISDALNWDDVAWLQASTRLPVIVKGILTKEDGAMAVQCGVGGVWVSNHGGRQLDGVASSAEALVEVLEGVREAERLLLYNGSSGGGVGKGRPPPRIPVWVDGGVRRGTDVVKLLALGADFVWVGKPVIWGLIVGGEDALFKLLSVLSAEVKNALQLLGLSGVDKISRRCVSWRAAYTTTTEPKRLVSPIAPPPQHYYEAASVPSSSTLTDPTRPPIHTAQELGLDTAAAGTSFQPPHLPSGWEERLSQSTGRRYYFSYSLKKSVWDIKDIPETESTLTPTPPIPIPGPSPQSFSPKRAAPLPLGWESTGSGSTGVVYL